MTAPFEHAQNGSIRVRDHYDDRMLRDLTRNYYGQSGFFNLGYWHEHTRDQQEACINLVEELLAFLPVKRGRILDAGCGLGATTRHLLRYYQPSDTIGINISARQLAFSKSAAQGSQFYLMDAAHLAFADCSFETVISVEAVFHFKTRVNFLQEAHRVLVPGGSLVLSDMLAARWSAKVNPFLPEENYVNDVTSYADIYRQVGFKNVQVVDATRPCLGGFSRHLRRWAWDKKRAGQISMAAFSTRLIWLSLFNLATRRYLLVAATKA